MNCRLCGENCSIGPFGPQLQDAIDNYDTDALQECLNEVSKKVISFDLTTGTAPFAVAQRLEDVASHIEFFAKTRSKI